MEKPLPDANQVLFPRVPLFVRRVLHVNCGRGLLGGMLKTREGGVEVYGVASDPGALADARARLDSVLAESVETGDLPFPNGHFDCIVLDDPERHGAALSDVLVKLAPLLAPNGLLLMPVAERDGALRPLNADALNAALAHVDLALYVLWPWAVLGAAAPFPAGFVNPHPKWVCHVVRPTYDPTAHAAALFEAGHPDRSYEVLCAIPDHYRTVPEVDAAIQAEKQFCLLAMDTPHGAYPTLRLFCGALMLFYRVVELAPHHHAAYLTQAEFWHRIGDDDMAARLLRSIHHATQNDAIAAQRARYTAPSPVREETAPEWDGHLSGRPRTDAWRPRILMILPSDCTHYGLDVLYDGLCRVLGDDHVVEYPWKPTLHGHMPDRFAYYPCLFDRPGDPVALDQILHQLRDGRFDCVLFSHVEMALERDTVRRLMLAARHLPLFVLDAEDDAFNNLPEVVEFLGGPTVLGYFKRELLACVDFGPTTFPLPFAYPDDRVLEDLSGPRPRAIFWAGQRVFGLRRLCLERLEAITGDRFDQSYDQDVYVAELRTSRMGMNFFGAGFDCVRYWELPANGCMLFSDRLPIRVPHNFRDGESAVFFDDLEDFEQKVEYYLAHPDEVAAIARAGHAHFKRYHTATARARQLLGYMQHVLGRA